MKKKANKNNKNKNNKNNNKNNNKKGGGFFSIVKTLMVPVTVALSNHSIKKIAKKIKKNNKKSLKNRMFKYAV